MGPMVFFLYIYSGNEVREGSGMKNKLLITQVWAVLVSVGLVSVIEIL